MRGDLLFSESNRVMLVGNHMVRSQFLDDLKSAIPSCWWRCSLSVRDFLLVLAVLVEP